MAARIGHDRVANDRFSGGQIGAITHTKFPLGTTGRVRGIVGNRIAPDLRIGDDNLHVHD